MQIAESPAALEWKRRKLNNGVSVPVTPLAAVIDNDIWAPDALTNAWRAAVLDFQEAATGLPHNVSVDLKRSRSAIWYGTEAPEEEPKVAAQAPSSSSSSDTSSDSSSSSDDSSSSSDDDDDAPPVVLSAILPPPSDSSDSSDDEDSGAMVIEQPEAPAIPPAPALAPASPHYQPQSPTFNYESTPPVRPVAPSAVPDLAPLPGSLDTTELQALLDRYWSAGYALGRFHAKMGMPDSLKGR